MSPLPGRVLVSRKILVVDDQPSIRGVLERALTEAGADVWTAPDGPSALKITQATPPDLILLDLVMPGMNGWQVIQALNASPDSRAIPVVLETSVEQYAAFDRAKHEGVAAFLSKPFRLAEVIETCRRVLLGARPLQGTRPEGEQAATVQIRDSMGNIMSVGHLLDLSPTGAQIQLDASPSLGQWLSLTYSGETGLETVPGQVRWVTRSGDAYQVGLSLRRTAPSSPSRL